MERTGNMNIRVNPEVKRNAEAVLAALGLSMSAAVTIYLKQIALTGGIPFKVALPQAPEALNADLMDKAALEQKLQEGLEDIKAGRVQDATEAFAAFKNSPPRR